MSKKAHNKIVSYIWGIADDVLRDVFVRGKYRDVILPFTVLRRLDVLLEESKEEVLKAHQFLTDNNINDTSSLTNHAKYPFYNTCLLYTSPSPRDQRGSRMPSSA